ncbi:MAG: hypothetical protein WC872_02580 [Candidatus Absconditabacterales bacterium]
MRVKRFHSFDLPGANRKDVVYRRGLEDVIQFIKNADKKNLQQEMHNFYITKLGEKELKNEKYIEELLQGFDINENEIIMPIAIGKILYEKLLGHNLNQIDDFRFKLGEGKLNHKQKKLLLEILHFIKEHKIESE